ncbi:MAG: hypothetical protein P1V97_33655, partial [Planctomycetota bacterium]|nr:hypothetical protein [Planctomycetota bacterium]
LQQLFHSFPWKLSPSQRQIGLTLRHCPILNDKRLQFTNAEMKHCFKAITQFTNESDENRLPVESLGSLYECVLEQTVVKVEELSVVLKCSKQKVPLESLQKLEAKFQEGPEAFRDFLLHRTGRSDRSLQKDLDAIVSKKTERPGSSLSPLLKTTEDGSPILLAPQSLYLVDHTQRRQSGTHYTPTTLTKQVVSQTLCQFSKAQTEHQSETVVPILDRRICDVAMGSGAFLLESCRYLAKLAETESIPATNQQKTVKSSWKQRVAESCLFGVDVNLLAVDIAKCSLWLEIANSKLPLSFLDEHLKVGDSLLGLPINNKSFYSKAQEQKTAIRKSVEAFQSEEVSSSKLERLAADVWIGIQLGASSQKRAIQAHKTWQNLCQSHVTYPELRDHGNRLLREGKLDSSQEVTCFHWELEFPLIFNSKKARGFDAILGNPPFLGGRNISASFGKSYNRWLTQVHPGSSGEADLVAHFLRRAWDLIKPNGLVGFVAKEIISQGETRLAGLQYLLDRGATIFRADTDIVWPGPAAVSVSLIHLSKGPWSGLKTLNGNEVKHISSFLGNEIINKEPCVLKVNKNKAFQGVIPHSTGFEFKKNGTLEQSFNYMNELIEKDPRNAQLIQPYIGGEDLNESLNLEPSRYIVNFGDRSESEAREWPDLFSLIERRVKPDRMASKSKDVNDYPFWKYWRQRKKLYKTIEGMERVLATNAQASVYLCFAFLDAKAIFQNSLNIFTFSDHASFAVLQSNLHSIYSWFLCSNLGAGIRYNPTDCFVTFPFPKDWKSRKPLDSAGQLFYAERAHLMNQESYGLTKLYERFHSSLEQSNDFNSLRALHRKLDHTVLEAYHWDIDAEHGFYDHGYGERYSVSPKARKLILARLLELNEQRFHSE